MSKYIYGCNRQDPDLRDFKPLRYHLVAPFNLPPSVDLRTQFDIPVYDQGQYGSCVANGTAFGHQWCQYVESETAPFIPSRFFIYFKARSADGDQPTDDAGTTIRQGMAVINKFGVPPETEWPYIDANFSTPPTDVVAADAALHKSLNY